MCARSSNKMDVFGRETREENTRLDVCKAWNVQISDIRTKFSVQCSTTELPTDPADIKKMCQKHRNVIVLC
jgi:hypothetical protein